MKLHVGCGTVYLDGYVNIDMPGSHTLLANESPDTVEALRTTERDYYARHKDVTEESVVSGPSHQGGVCDAYGALQALPVEDGAADEILARQVFEHLSITEAKEALYECNRALRSGGILRIDVPDHEQSMAEYRKTGEAFFKRHVLGSRKDEFAYHIMGYTVQALVVLAKQFGFSFIQQEWNIHFYPAFCLRFKKEGEWEGTVLGREVIRPWKASWEYCGEPRGTELVVPDEWRCLEVGPGKNPWPRADVYVDADESNLRGDGWLRNATDYEKEKTVHVIEGVVADIHALPAEWTDCFDFVFCSHCLEHVDDPIQACAELQRVAKRGVIVTPSALKESLFAFEEPTHRWLVTERDGLRFEALPQWAVDLRDDDMQRVAHRLYRLGSPNLGLDGIHARCWFRRAEPYLDVIYRWEGSIDVEVVDD